MIKNPCIPTTRFSLLLFILAAAFSVGAAERHTLIVNGRSTEVLVSYVNGHPYVGLEALANSLNGSVSSSGAKVAFSLPTSSANCAPSPTTASPAPEPVPAGMHDTATGYVLG